MILVSIMSLEQPSEMNTEDKEENFG